MSGGHITDSPRLTDQSITDYFGAPANCSLTVAPRPGATRAVRIVSCRESGA
jgi:hypothetical protein